jgi:hypothetical protein
VFCNFKCLGVCMNIHVPGTPVWGRTGDDRMFLSPAGEHVDDDC